MAAIYRTPVLDLIFRAAEVHRAHHDPSSVQVCVLQSIKTGGCPEDCGYCPQAARYHTSVEAEPLMDVEAVLAAARAARDSGASRFCMGAAWREVKDNRQFDRVLEMIRGVKDLGLEACATLGMVTEDQARRMKEAGLDAYNHNLDSSEAFYDRIIQTRTYRDRLDTLANVRKAGITVCCGGIVGMGESDDDRIGLLAHPGQPARAARVGADQRPGGRRGDAAGRPAQRLDLGHGPDDRHGPDPDAHCRWSGSPPAGSG